MGPTIILDKSTLQALTGKDETPFLRRYFIVNMPPVLLHEIGADLRKKVKMPEEEVQTLSRKLSQLDSMASLYHRDMARIELIGEEKVPMNGTIPITGKYVSDDDGNRCFVADESEREADFLRWQIQKYVESDYADAEEWRSLPGQTLEELRNEHKDIVQELKVYETLPALVNYIDQMLAATVSQPIVFEIFQKLGHFDDTEFIAVTNRWKKAGEPPLRQFAPYSFFCAVVTFTHQFGVLRGFFNTRAKDLYDLQYVFYLPFCNVFSSSDNFLKAIVPALMRKDQIFISGDELKSDLAKLVECRNQLTGDALEQWMERYNSHPPAESRAYKIREQLGWTERSADSSRENMSDVPIARKRRIHPDSPCICTSGKTFRVCCYPKMRKQSS